ncbi:heme-binding protein [Hymenobacter arcticus]
MDQALIDRILAAGLAMATQLNIPATITIVDSGGHLRAVMRQAECSYFSLESSRKKALTASQLKIPSAVVGTVGQQFPLLQAAFAANADITGLPGGVPIRLNGQVVGGLGAAGGDFNQDQQIADAALAAMATT